MTIVDARRMDSKMHACKLPARKLHDASRDVISDKMVNKHGGYDRSKNTVSLFRFFNKCLFSQQDWKIYVKKKIRKKCKRSNFADKGREILFTEVEDDGEVDT